MLCKLGKGGRLEAGTVRQGAYRDPGRALVIAVDEVDVCAREKVPDRECRGSAGEDQSWRHCSPVGRSGTPGSGELAGIDSVSVSVSLGAALG